MKTLSTIEFSIYLEICQAVFAYNDKYFDLNRIKSKSREISLVMSRKVCIMALSKVGISYYDIAAFLDLDRVTCMHHDRKSSWAKGWEDIKFPEHYDQPVIKKISQHRTEIEMLTRQISEQNRLIEQLKKKLFVNKKQSWHNQLTTS